MTRSLMAATNLVCCSWATTTSRGGQVQHCPFMKRARSFQTRAQQPFRLLARLSAPSRGCSIALRKACEYPTNCRGRKCSMQHGHILGQFIRRRPTGHRSRIATISSLVTATTLACLTTRIRGSSPISWHQRRINYGADCPRYAGHRYDVNSKQPPTYLTATAS